MTSEERGRGYDGLRRDIERTRAEIGETVEALAARADVKARAHQMADEARTRVRETTRDAATTATRLAQPMMRRPVAWVLAALAGIGVVFAVRARWR